VPLCHPIGHQTVALLEYWTGRRAGPDQSARTWEAWPTPMYWISDARPQECTNLQSLVECLDRKYILCAQNHVTDTVCSHARLCQAAQQH